jgi:hypothetical protein
MVELIPAQYYVFKEEEFVQSTKYFHNIKASSDHASNHVKTKTDKRDRLDPSNVKSVQELKEEAEEFNDEESMEIEEEKSEINHLKLKLEKIESVPLSELRQRLRDKIAECRGKRKTSSENELENDSKHKKTKKKKVDGKSKTIAQIETKKGEATNVSYNATGDNRVVLYNKLDFGTGEGQGYKRKKKKGSNNLKQLLLKAEESQKKIKEITERDTEKGEELAEKMKWRQTLDKAKGIQNKDNPILLKKSIKKQEKRKKQSLKKWTERKENQDHMKNKKQDKRHKNIQERIEAKKAKVSKTKAKRGKKKIRVLRG